VELVLDACRVRSWRMSDAASLVKYGNNRNIWINLRDRFPHPYRRGDARDYLSQVRDLADETFFAIDVGGEAVGAIGYVLQPDVERVSAEIGYWLGEPFWGRGIATAALAATTRYAFARHQLTRVFALPFARNLASCRVLEKCGYVVEGHLRRSAIKDGLVLDQILYACYGADADGVPSADA
jgi:ribosomal-protein-alanine N-acetyltransferase